MSFNGKTPAFQAGVASSILVVRSEDHTTLALRIRVRSMSRYRRMREELRDIVCLESIKVMQRTLNPWIRVRVPVEVRGRKRSVVIPL
jgi:hypothetical protein